jgi:hypothetical protein
MNVLDTATAFARVEQGLCIASFASTYPASVYICCSIFPLRCVGRILRIVHNIWRCFGGCRAKIGGLSHDCGYSRVISPSKLYGDLIERQGLALMNGVQPFEKTTQLNVLLSKVCPERGRFFHGFCVSIKEGLDGVMQRNRSSRDIVWFDYGGCGF